MDECEESHVIKHHRRREGFTLIEILVVLGIIGILLGLSIAAVMRVQTLQQIRSSSDVVEKVQVAIDNQYKAIITQAQLDIRSQQPQDAQAIVNYFNSVGGDPDSALALLTYCRVRQSFPQTFAEVQLPATVVNGVTYQGFTVVGAYFPVKSQFQQFASATTAPSTNLSPAQQSAALLYAAVAATGAGGSTFASDDATTSAQMDFSVQGSITIHVYKDAWNQPIGFCRFGTNFELQNTIPSNQFPTIYVNPKATFQDPFDPSGKLLAWATNTATAGQANAIAGTLFVNTGDPANATNFAQTSLVPGGSASTNRRPVVFSNGYNQTYESLNNAPVSIPGKGPQDDILGYRLTQLGQRGTIQGH
jgi:prepilin-type N-terminal cleavage/methylation domain-containing protein